MSNKRYFYIATSIKTDEFSGNGYSFLETNGSYPYFHEARKAVSSKYGFDIDAIVVLSVIEFNSYQDFIDARDGMND